MRNRVKINVSSELADMELIQPEYFRQAMPTSGNAVPSKIKSIPFVQSRTSKRKLSNKLQELKQKKTSIDMLPFDQSSESAKEQLKSFSQTGSFEKNENNSISNLVGNVANHLQAQKGKTQNKRKKKFELKEIIKRQKVSNICSKFIDKLQRNNCQSAVIDYKGYEVQQKESFLQLKGFEINKVIDNIIAFLSILQITCLFFSYTLAIVFPQVQQAAFIRTLQYLGLAFYLIEMAYNCITVKANAGKKLVNFKQILIYYFQTNMMVDVISFLILLIDCMTSLAQMDYIRLFIIAKLPQCLEKMQKLQAFFIKNYYNQQYWSLIKVILFNFCFAHMLAIILSAMGNTNSNNTSWLTVKGIDNASWFERYVWAYYWGTTIMLTIGFGDITATTYEQALCLTAVQIFSVMCLAYNINSVGTLISNIRSQEKEKSKNYKTFKQLSDKYEISNELQEKINHYIQESVNIRKKFNLQQENQFLLKLPSDLKKQYLKQSNRSVFYNLTFFGNLIDKTLYAFAQSIEMSISHPQQTIRRIDDDYNLLILRQGQIGFTSKRRNCNFNDMIIDRVKVIDIKKPFLLGLQFLTRKRPNYEIKSLEYSVIYYLQYEKLIKNLKESQMDYHHFCFMRDKDRTIIDQLEAYPCEFCEKRHHTKFSCPKLHFMPLKQMVIYKQHNKQRKGKNLRNANRDHRIPTNHINALLNYKIINRVAQQQSQKHNKTYNKQSNPFLDRLAQLKKIQSEDIKEDVPQPKSQQLFLKYTSEIIRLQFNRFKISENFQDQVWTIGCDKMRNFKEYFPQCNPCLLQENFDIHERLKHICSKQESTSFITSKSPAIGNLSKVTSKARLQKNTSQEL